MCYSLVNQVSRLFFGVFFCVLLLSANIYSANPDLKNVFPIRDLNNLVTLDSKITGSWCVIFDDVSAKRLYKQLRQKSFDLKKCKKISVPGSDLVFNDIPKNNRTVWLYKSFSLDFPKQNASKQLAFRLGTISDVDATYLNGIQIGQTGNFESDLPQNYDKIRIYTFDRGLLKKKGAANHLLIKVKPYFRGDLSFGILQDTVKIGSTEMILTNFYFGQFFKLLVLTIYFSVAFYFLFLFLRRRTNFDDLYFALFAAGISVYEFLRTQVKYELGLDFLTLKKIEYSTLVMLPVLCTHFIRTFFDFKYKRYHQFFDITSGCLFAYFILGSDLMSFNSINSKYNILLLLCYVVLILRFLIIKTKEKNFDGMVIFGGTCMLFFGVITDQLTTREIIVFPRIVGYLFIFYVLSLATILANKFVRLNEEVEELNEGLEEKVKSRTEELNQTLTKVIKLKDQQDGDYFLTSLLIQPLIKNSSNSRQAKIEFYTKQKKEFTFKEKKYEIGGDISIADNINLQGKDYIIFANADAMGKSIQGAGGAIVWGVVFHAFLSRSRTSIQRNKTPELWMKEAFLEMQNVFETFDCSMLISIFLGMIDEATGFMYFINAEHPWGVIYRNDKAEFLGSELSIRKIGIPKSQNDFLIKTYQLEPDDMIFIGSDGRDDLRISTGENSSIVNSDEKLFLKEVEEANGDLNQLVTNLENVGELTDDLTLVKITYMKEEKEYFDYQKIKEIYAEAKKLYQQGKFDECIQFCQNDFKLDKKSARIARLLSYAHFKTNNFQKSASYLQDYLYYHPNSERDIYRASRVAQKNKQYEKAIDYAEQVYLRNPKFMQK